MLLFLLGLIPGGFCCGGIMARSRKRSARQAQAERLVALRPESARGVPVMRAARVSPESLRQQAMKYAGSPQLAERWLTSPHARLDGRTPLECAVGGNGARATLQLERDMLSWR